MRCLPAGVHTHNSRGRVLQNALLYVKLSYSKYSIEHSERNQTLFGYSATHTETKKLPRELVDLVHEWNM